MPPFELIVVDDGSPVNAGEGGPVPWSVPPMPRETRLYLTLLAFDWYIIPPASVMFRRAVVEEIGGFRDPWGADDLDFISRRRAGTRHGALKIFVTA